MSQKSLISVSSNKEHKRMKINTPLNLSPEEIKSFNEIVKPQLEELYSYNYGKFEFKNTKKSAKQISGMPETQRVSEHTKIFISKDKFPDSIKRPNFEEIKNILNKIPEKHFEFISDIYFVSYHCKDDNDKEIKGRTLPIVNKIIIYPKVREKINNVLIHEIGHVLFDKLLNLKQKTEISQIAFMASIRALSYTKIERYKFVQEYFAGAYEDFLNEKKLVSRNPFLLRFLTILTDKNN